MHPKPEPVIAAAVGTAVKASGNPSRAKRIEAAQSAAVMDALAEGISLDDSETLLARKHAARLFVTQTGG